MVTTDTTLKGWDSRYVRVDYPQKITLEGDAQYLLGPAPDNKCMTFTTPETNTNGDTDFLSREMAVLVNYIVMQMDKSVHARLDIDAFMNSLRLEQDGHGFETTK
jgi:hypothetical protein